MKADVSLRGLTRTLAGPPADTGKPCQSPGKATERGGSPLRLCEAMGRVSKGANGCLCLLTRSRW